MITNVVEQLDNAEIFGGRDFEVRPFLKVGGRTCQCAECGQFFTGVGAFDRHMVGTVRCRTPDQMRAAGMTANIYGVWQLGVSAATRSAYQLLDEAGNTRVPHESILYARNKVLGRVGWKGDKQHLS